MTNTHGGKRDGAGRKLGIPNKTTAEIRDLAKEYAPQAIEKLYNLMLCSESDKIQLMACKEILDRGYGRSVASVIQETDYRCNKEEIEETRRKLLERAREFEEAKTL